MRLFRPSAVALYILYLSFFVLAVVLLFFFQSFNQFHKFFFLWIYLLLFRLDNNLSIVITVITYFISSVCM